MTTYNGIGNQGQSFQEIAPNLSSNWGIQTTTPINGTTQTAYSTQIYTAFSDTSNLAFATSLDMAYGGKGGVATNLTQFSDDLSAASAQIESVSSNSSTGYITSATVDPSAYSSFFTNVASDALGMSLTGGNTSNMAMIDQIAPLIYPNDANAATDLVNNIVSDSLNNFLKTYTPSASLSGQDLANNFAQAFDTYFTRFAQAVDFQNIISAYFPDASSTEDTQTLASYVSQLMSASNSAGFNPSQQIGAWLSDVQGKYLSSLSGTETPIQSSLGDTYRKPVILNNIFALIIQIIGTLQSVTASQANYLQVLTNWQAAYTSLQNQIHTFVAGEQNVYISNASDSDHTYSQARSDLNNLNQTYTAQIQSERSIIEDNAKSIQSNINQDNDSVNQESDIASSILSDLKSIMNSITK